jgi:hypothetical protein
MLLKESLSKNLLFYQYICFLIAFRQSDVWRYAAYRLNSSNFPAYKYIILIRIMFIFTTNCGMQYERVLAAVVSYLKDY